MFYYIQLYSVYSEWSDWSECTQTCGGGTQTRDRSCTQGDCSVLGEPAEEQQCGTEECPRKYEYTNKTISFLGSFGSQFEINIGATSSLDQEYFM